MRIRRDGERWKCKRCVKPEEWTALRAQFREAWWQSLALTAEELAELREWSATSWNGIRWQKAIATIDAQAATVAELQREIEGYRQALEVLRDAEGLIHAIVDGVDEHTIFQIAEGWSERRTKAILRCERALAGKEAQG